MALGVFGAGAVSTLAVYFWSKGKTHEAFALGIASGIVSTTLAAVKVLGSGSEPQQTVAPGYGIPV